MDYNFRGHMSIKEDDSITILLKNGKKKFKFSMITQEIEKASDSIELQGLTKKEAYDTLIYTIKYIKDIESIWNDLDE